MCLDDRGSLGLRYFAWCRPERYARRRSPDPAVCMTEGLRPHVKLGDVRSARWQGREALPRRAYRR